jgi:hypothetical protein
MLVLLLWLSCICWTQDKTFSITLLLRVASVFVFCVSMWILREIFPLLRIMSLEYWLGLNWISRLFLVIWHPINSVVPWTWAVFTSSGVSYNSRLPCFKFSLQRSSASLLKCVPMHSCCEWDCFLGFFLFNFVVGIWKRYWFLYVNFVSCNLLKIFIKS